MASDNFSARFSRSIAAGSAFLAALCFCSAPVAAERGASGASYDKALSAIVKGKGPTDPIAAAALAVKIDGELVYAGAAGCAEFQAKKRNACKRPFGPETKFRVASISKMALAIGVDDLVEEGKVDLDRDVSAYLGWTFRNPAFPDRPITARQLLSHKSSLRDPEEYWIAAPGQFRALFEVAAPPFAPPVAGVDVGPGAWFKYANLNYGVLAGIIEGASGERFDRLMTERVFEPLGLDIGYNWSGVSPAARREGAVLYQRDGKSWAIANDSPENLAAALPSFLAPDGFDREAFLANYRPGDNPTLFSPQGGLRASVVDLAALVSKLSEKGALVAPQWRFDAVKPNGDAEEGFFAAFGLGVQTAPGNASLLEGRSLIGHAGEAYGVYSGAWILKAKAGASDRREVVFAFAATGVSQTPAKGTHPTFNAVEERLVRLAARVAEDHAARKAASEPRPFDERADAQRDVDAALLAAAASGKNVLLVLGANWCHDSRGLAGKFEDPTLASIIESGFHLVFVDVGQRDRNLDVAARFGVAEIVGTPTILILSSKGDLLNRDSVHDWRTADSKSLEEAIAYFSGFAKAAN